MDANTSREVCEIIMGLLLVDGELHQEEARFLARVRSRFGLSHDTKIAPVKDAAEALAKLRGLDAEDRNETLSLMIAAAGADGVVHHAERILLGTIAEELGIDEEELERRLEQPSPPSEPKAVPVRESCGITRSCAPSPSSPLSS